MSVKTQEGVSYASRKAEQGESFYPLLLNIEAVMWIDLVDVVL